MEPNRWSSFYLFPFHRSRNRAIHSNPLQGQGPLVLERSGQKSANSVTSLNSVPDYYYLQYTKGLGGQVHSTALITLELPSLRWLSVDNGCLIASYGLMNYISRVYSVFSLGLY